MGKANAVRMTATPSAMTIAPTGRGARTPLPAPRKCEHTGRMLYPQLRGDGRLVWLSVR